MTSSRIGQGETGSGGARVASAGAVYVGDYFVRQGISSSK